MQATDTRPERAAASSAAQKPHAAYTVKRRFVTNRQGKDLVRDLIRAHA